MDPRSSNSHHGYHELLSPWSRSKARFRRSSSASPRLPEDERLRVILLLAGVLALQSADIGSIGALAGQLEKAFGLGNTQLGLLITVTALVGAAVALPAGQLADRANRVRVLSWAVALWSLGMVASGLAPDYAMLLLARVALGVLAAVCGPMVASLTGDLFPAQDRSRVYGMILTGELLGTGVGLVIAAELGAVAGWHAPFFVLAVPSIVLAVLLWRLLPEPARGGQSWLYPGAEEIKPAEEANGQEPPTAGQTAQSLGMDEPAPALGSDVRQGARARQDVHADSKLVLRQDPSCLSPRAAVAYILRIRSNLVLIAASVLGYFFLAGLQAFAVLFAEDHFGISQALVSLVLIVVGAGWTGGDVVRGPPRRQPGAQRSSRRTCPGRRYSLHNGGRNLRTRSPQYEPADRHPPAHPGGRVRGRSPTTARRRPAGRRALEALGPRRSGAEFCP